MQDAVKRGEADGLAAELEELGRSLARRQQAAGSSVMRRRLAMGAGAISPLRYFSKEEIRSLFGGLPLVGVDGSLDSCGAGSPYTVTFFRALARSTRGSDAGGRYWTCQVFSPLLEKYQARLKILLDQGLNDEDALAHIRWEILASMEAEVGQAAMEQERPRMLLWDGGFARLEIHAPAIWERLKELALRQGVIMLGVTEEIATHSLVGLLGGSREFKAGPLRDALAGWGDREFLYGVLRPGEVFRADAKRGDSVRWGRIYTRLARHPQVIAVDYLTEQAGELETALNFLYTITPSHGRGFPLWLDVVDAEARITGEQVEVMLAAHLDPALRELFLRPLRLRRDL